MLKEAEDDLVVHSAEDLNGLLTAYEKDYLTENILNEEIGDQRWKDDSYDNFDYEYSNAQNVVDSGDSKDITDAWETLFKAHNDLNPLKEVTKADFAAEIAKLQAAQKKEFDYEAWQRGTVSGTGTKYDNQTYAWGMLFYHVWSAFDKINDQFESIKDIKTLNKTTDEEVVKAYEACQEAVKVLNGFTADKMTSYRNEDAVLNIVNKEFKDELLDNEKFVRHLLMACISSAGLESGSTATTVCLEKPTQDKDGNYVAPKGSTLAEIREAIEKNPDSNVVSKFVKKNQLTIYRTVNGFKYVDGKLQVTKNTSAEGYEAGVDGVQLVGNKELPDLVQVLGQMTYGGQEYGNCTKQANSIWDGNYRCTNTKAMGDGSKLVKGEYTELNPKMYVANSNGCGAKVAQYGVTGWFLAPGSGEAVNNDKFMGPSVPISAGSAYNTAVSKSNEIKEVALSPSIQTALSALNGKPYYHWNEDTSQQGGYSGVASLKGELAGKSLGKRRNAEKTVISSSKVALESIERNKVSTAEWTAIGNYLKLALEDWLIAPEKVEYTVNDAYKLVESCDDLIVETSKAQIFATANNALVTARDLLLEEANKQSRTKGKIVDKDLYEDVEDAIDALEEIRDAFKYDYGEIRDYIAKVAKELDDSTSPIAGNVTVEQDMKDTAAALIKVSDLVCTDDSEDVPDDVTVDDEFADYNRVYTEAKDFDLADVTIAEAEKGPNRAHFDLKTAYEKLMKDYNAAVEAASADVTFDFDGDGVVDTLDVIALNKAIANEETIDLKFDLDGDSAVTSLDAKELAYRIAQELV